MKQNTVKAAIVFDCILKEFKAVGYLSESDFTDGAYQTDYSNYVLVKMVDVDFDVPEGFDTIKPQLNALDAKEKELTFQYNQALQHIKVARNNLLALEN